MDLVPVDNIVQQLNELSNEWAEAELHGDTAFLQQTLADSFTGISPLGALLTKEEWIDNYQSGELHNDTFHWERVSTRVYGDTAILIGHEIQKGKFQEQEIQGQFRVRLIFVRQEASWRLAEHHLTGVNQRNFMDL